RPVTEATVVSLAILRCGVVDLEEELQQRAIVGHCGVVDDFNGLSVRAVIAVGRMRNVAAAVTDPGRDHSRLPADQVLHAPEAAARENRLLGSCHCSSSLTGHDPANTQPTLHSADE